MVSTPRMQMQLSKWQLVEKAVSQVYEGERKFDLRLRYDQPYRSSIDQIGNLLVPTLNGGKIPLKEISLINNQSGSAFIYREDNARFIAVKFSVRGRDLGSAVDEARDKVSKHVKLTKGYEVKWNGEFENQERAEKQLMFVVPISILLIFFILFASFWKYIGFDPGSFKCTFCANWRHCGVAVHRR